MLSEILRTPLYWMLLFVPAVLFAEHARPEARTLASGPSTPMWP
jgi:hypothetical protein